MADPGSMDDLTKVAGGGGLGAAVAAVVTFLTRAATGQRLDRMAEMLGKLEAQMAVLVAASERRDEESQRLDATRRLALLEARVDAIQRTLDQVVQS